jgi:hypothetical protein
MLERLIEETDLSERLAISCDIEDGDIDLYIGTADISTRCGFDYEEWETFVEHINKANEKYRELTQNINV